MLSRTPSGVVLLHPLSVLFLRKSLTGTWCVSIRPDQLAMELRILPFLCFLGMGVASIIHTTSSFGCEFQGGNEVPYSSRASTLLTGLHSAHLLTPPLGNYNLVTTILPSHFSLQILPPTPPCSPFFINCYLMPIRVCLYPLFKTTLL